MSFTQLAIEKNRVTYVALILIFFGGIIAFNSLPQDEDPGFIIRTALVITYFPGASPERVEQLITDKIEKAAQEIPELDFVMSNSRTGVSEIYVNIKERYKKMRPIWDNLRRKIDRVKSDLPGGVIGPFVNDEFGDVFGIVITMTGDGFNYAELKEMADQVRDEFLRITDVAKVEIYGAQEEHIYVEYNNAKLAEIGLSPVQLKNILGSKNIINPGGDVRIENQRIVLEPQGNLESVEELRSTLIGLPGTGEIVQLRDIANIYRGYADPPKSMIRSSNLDALAIGISMRTGGNIVELGNEVRKIYNHLQSVYPVGVEFDIVAFQPDHVSAKVNDFVMNLFQAVALVLFVMLLSLGIRTGLVVATLIPMAMLMTLLIMDYAGMQLDQMSLASLIIALGMLVDNAIVMSESVMVQMGEGKTGVQAAIGSAAELRVPLLTSSLTTAAAFLPIALAKSAVGEYTGVIFTVVTITLLSSWVLSLTLTPLMASQFLRVEKKENPYNNKFYIYYRRFLSFLLHNRGWSVVGIIVIFFITMQLAALVPNIFFPANDKAIMTCEVTLPEGTAIERTREVVMELDRYVEENLKTNENREDGVSNWSSYIGAGAPRFTLGYNPQQISPGYGLLLINTTSREFVDTAITKLGAYCFNNFPEAITKVSPLQLGPPVDNPVAIRVAGKDPDILQGLVESVKEMLIKQNRTINIKDDWGVRTQKILVKIDEARAKRAGLTNQDIAVSLQTLLSGFQTTEYREGDKIIPVTMRTIAKDRDDIDKVESLNIYSLQTGKAVPLRQVADIELVWQPSKIMRRDRYKTVTISAGLVPGNTTLEVVNELDQTLCEAKKEWPVGYYYEYGGELETSAKANKSIMDQLPVAFFIIILLLVVQFNSIRKPLIILITIPLGVIGVFLGLLAFQSYFGFMTLLGVVSLSGIVINNAIVLLERIKLEIDENGLSPQRAVIEASQRRLRPILLTTATTIGGLIPLYLGGGPMWEPMAVAIMCGLLFATLLTLGMVPVFYSLFFKVKYTGYNYDKDIK